MKKIVVPTRTGSDWQRLLAKPRLHWKMGASAMTAAASWEASGDSLPPEIRERPNCAHDAHLSDLARCDGDPKFLDADLPSAL